MSLSFISARTTVSHACLSSTTSLIAQQASTFVEQMKFSFKPSISKHYQVLLLAFAGMVLLCSFVPARRVGLNAKAAQSSVFPAKREGIHSRNTFPAKNNDLYDSYHSKRGLGVCSACKHVKTITGMFPCAKKIYDAGAGNCLFTRALIKEGLEVSGTEFATTPVKEFCKDLVDAGVIFQAGLTDIPFKNDHFDLVTSFEVLEHVPETDIDKAVAELVRVSTGHVLMTISLRRAAADPPFPEEPFLHITVKPRSWWDEKFEKNGCRVNRFLHDVLQKTWIADGGPSVEATNKYSKSRMRSEFVKTFGSQENNIIWPGNEVEPWFFAYTCKEKTYSIPACKGECERLVQKAVADHRLAGNQAPVGDISCE